MLFHLQNVGGGHANFLELQRIVDVNVLIGLEFELLDSLPLLVLLLFQFSLSYYLRRQNRGLAALQKDVAQMAELGVRDAHVCRGLCVAAGEVVLFRVPGGFQEADVEVGIVNVLGPASNDRLALCELSFVPALPLYQRNLTAPTERTGVCDLPLVVAVLGRLEILAQHHDFIVEAEELGAEVVVLAVTIRTIPHNSDDLGPVGWRVIFIACNGQHIEEEFALLNLLVVLFYHTVESVLC